MRYNSIAATGLRVSEISFGAGTSAGLMIHGSAQEQEAAIRRALDVGINHFDTAAFYGYGASEVNLGRTLQATGARDILVTTKVAISREMLELRRLRHAVRLSVEQSLSRLRRDTIDILLIHNATHRTHAPYAPDRESERVARLMNTYIPPITFDDLLGEEGVLEEVGLLVSEGKVRHFGVSGQDNDPVILRALIGSRKIAVFNQTYNLLNPSAGYPAARGNCKVEGTFRDAQRELFVEFDDVIESARTAGVGVSVISALAAGVLTEAAERGDPQISVSRRDNRFPFPGQFGRQVAVARPFKAIAERAGMSLNELALRFVLSTPGVTTLVGGISSAEQIGEMALSAGKPPLTEDVLAELRTVWFGALSGGI